jgi:hypothetical protein
MPMSTVESDFYMSVTFTKLFSSITESTIWVAPDPHRLCWITMLAMADRQGRVWASIPGLANRARISVDDTRAAIASFLSPDPDSRTKDWEGRRIEEIDGGWRLLNHAKYRAIRDEEAIKEAKRKYINTRRAVENVDRGRVNAEAEADTEAKIKSKKKPTPLPEDFKISDNVKTWALQKGYASLEAYLEFFKGRMSANGKTYVDWDQAFINCVREDWPKLRGGESVVAPAACAKCGSTNWARLDRYKVCDRCQE